MWTNRPGRHDVATVKSYSVFVNLLLIIIILVVEEIVLAQDQPVQFARDIRPILSQKCFACHGFDEAARCADLRLDLPPSPESGVIVPGDPNASELIRRVSAPRDSDQRMPQPSTHQELTDAEIGLIRAWIQQGADYAIHWAFVRPRKPVLPPLPEELIPSGGNPIDYFVRDRLRQRGLAPAPPADRSALIRRLHLDLTGLPPTAAEVARFVNDADPAAYERLVERLLASPHFGERMALEWLDVARYADTNGYSIDGGRHMWMYRDWVIQAFNDNMPYDRFLIEQLAGDLLPNPSEGQLIATGFQRNHMITHEGGTIPEENLLNYNADRVKTFGEAVLGLTLGCAQCHNHKYDPISQREYYQLYAFFNGIDEQGLDGDGGRNAAPAIEARTVLQPHGLAEIERTVAKLNRELTTPDERRLEAWVREQRRRLAERGVGFALHEVEVLNVTTPNLGSGFAVNGRNAIRFYGQAGFLAFDISTRLPPLDQPIRGIRVVFHPDEQLPGGGWGRGVRKFRRDDRDIEKGSFVLTAVSLSADASPGEQVNLHALRRISQVTASSWDPAFWPADTLDPRYENGWSPHLQQDGPAHLTASLAEPIEANQTPYLAIHLNFGWGQGLIPARFSVFVFTGNDPDSDLPSDLIPLLETTPAQRTAKETAALWQHYAQRADETSALRVSLANHRERLRVFSDRFSTMVMKQAATPRETFVYTRGDYSQPAEKVVPGVPGVLPPLPSDAAPNRLTLARWVTSPDHPLTARVAVNRFWKMMFGRGLVATPADFGSQGSWPSHPELLDYLAVDFQENGWDIKRLIFQIVTSEIYRQSSFASGQALAVDPDNQWLARGPRFRLPAELIRDQALAVSGLLVPWIGGPSVNPYTPGDPWREISHYGSTQATAQSFVQDHGEKLYRRSLYTYWKRTSPPINMSLFDAPNREVCAVERPTTTTPLQALVMLNDVQFVEAQRCFAERILQQTGEDADRLAWAVVACLGREITAAETERLLAALTRERQRYRQAADSARELLSIGESPRNAELDVVEHAAWTIVAALLMNSSEFVTRN